MSAPRPRLADLLTARLAARLARVDGAAVLPEIAARGGAGDEHEAAIAAFLADPDRARADPLARIALAFGLSALEIDLVGAAIAPLEDERIGTILTGLGGTRRLTVADLLAIAVAPSADRLTIRRTLLDGPLWTGGLLAADPAADLFERRLETSPALARSLTGPSPVGRFACGGARVRIGQAEEERAVFPSLELGAARIAANDAAGMADIVAIDAPGGHIARGLAGALARRLGRDLLEVSGGPLAEIAPAGLILAAAWGALPLLAPDDNGGELGALPALPTPVIVLSRRVSVTDETATVLAVRAAVPPVREREAVWHQILGPAARTGDLAEAVARLALADVPPAAMERAAAAARLAPDGSGRTAADALLAAAAEAMPPPETPLGAVYRPAAAWSDLVLDARPRAQLEDVVRRVRHRARVLEDWGMAPPYGRAVVVLLHGEAGTGKTLAVEAVAARLALPLVRADLSAIASKYIGETEKHLARLFDLAEGFGAILFFDEADALFSRRTGVSDSHDRYANIQTNYLLQRLERLSDGLVFLATNLKQNMDEAFVRRIGVSIHLPRPTQVEQFALWHGSLPEAARVPGLALERLVERFDLVGGEIRNAALAAAFIAAEEGTRVGHDHLERAIAAELEKAGRPRPARRAGANGRADGRADAAAARAGPVAS